MAAASKPAPEKVKVDGDPEVIEVAPVITEGALEVDGDPTVVVEPSTIARAQDPAQTPTVEIDGRQVNPAVPDPRGELPADIPFISEGVARDIEMNGFAIDGFTGRRLTRDDLPEGRRKAKELAPQPGVKVPAAQPGV